MTAGERLIEQGVQKGIQQGIQQGQRIVLLQQIRRRFGADMDEDIERRVANASSEQLAVWADRVLTAATVAELLVD